MQKKVLAVTGIRSEYDILFPVIKVLAEDPRFIVKVAACGAHLSDWHGNTYQRIIDDGFDVIDRIDYLLMTNRDVQRAKGVGLLIFALAQTVERYEPDFTLVVGDREESIATAVVGNYMKKLVAHIGGGDPVFGNADDPIRFAVSKLAHIHLATAQQYADNLQKVGEEDFRIFFVGNPAYYNLANVPFISVDQLSQEIGVDITDGRYVVLIKHPLSSEKSQAYEQMKTVLNALARFCAQNNYKVLGIYPNTDPGSYDILRAIEEFKDHPLFFFFKTLPRDLFVNIMRGAKALVGNSSMGILEAPYYRLPVVNVGNRQRGRLNAGNVEFVPYDEDVIILAVQKAVCDEGYRSKIKELSNPFGDENAPYKIRDILAGIDVDDEKWYTKKRLV